MSRLGQVSLTKPTYRRIVLRCCSVPQAKPSPDYEYRISLRPHPVGHPSSSTRDFASRAVPSSIRVRRDRYREAGEWQQAEGDQRDRAAQKVFARAGSRKPRSDQHQECSTTDNHGYGRLTCMRRIKISPTLPIRECQIRYLKMPEITAKMTPGMVARRCVDRDIASKLARSNGRIRPTRPRHIVTPL
jgi:hypothetical protein